MFNVLFLGDVVGKVGRRILRERLSGLKRELSVGVTIVNGENSAGGLGIDPGTADEIFAAGADVITTGNHIWSKSAIEPYLVKHAQRIIRPRNYAPGAPGNGTTLWTSPEGIKLLIFNLSGRVFMPDLVDCPFRAANEVLEAEGAAADFVFLDFHAEATSEKIAMGHHLDGRAHMIVGTHTHVQTADERLLPKGTAFITDAGMCGPYDSIIGVAISPILERFNSGRPTRFETAKGRGQINGVLFTCDPQSRRVTHIKRIFEVTEQ